MITAEEARQLANYKKHFNAIKKAAIASKTHIFLYEPIEVQVFTDLGYDVQDNYSQKEGYCYKISW